MRLFLDMAAKPEDSHLGMTCHWDHTRESKLSHIPPVKLAVW